MTDTHLSSNKPFDTLDLKALTEPATEGAVRVTLTLPTERAGRDTTGNATRFRNLVSSAREKLEAAGHDADPILAPAQELHDDRDFWQHQGDGLLILLDGNQLTTQRLSFDLPESVIVANDYDLTALVPLLSTDTSLHLLALSRKEVRLFETDGTRIGRINLDNMIESEDDIYNDYDVQRTQQQAPKGGGEATFHAHTNDSDTDRIYRERFLRKVAQGIESEVAEPNRHPLVLAGVEELANEFRSVTGWGDVLDTVITGRVDEMSESQLLEKLQPVFDEVADNEAKNLAQQIDDARSGKRYIGAGEVLDAATQGQIATLLVAPDTESSEGEQLSDAARAINLVLRSGGEVKPAPETLEEKLAAITRW
ncbi:hypothetical protein [Rothia nasimurium]|uniref:baeRF3 domain-containing protein n=1 Tax=Rothia nasimurium TaxID=85336 RepID=UPI001F243E13|nr:hypothetical protein [Rothia nasimurium]